MDVKEAKSKIVFECRTWIFFGDGSKQKSRVKKTKVASKEILLDILKMKLWIANNQTSDRKVFLILWPGGNFLSSIIAKPFQRRLKLT